MKDFNIRDDSQIRNAIKRSNVVFNLVGAERETWNFSFEDVHVDAATRIAQAAAENPLTERFVHLSCLGASKDAASRRLRTKVRLCALIAATCILWCIIVPLAKRRMQKLAAEMKDARLGWPQQNLQVQEAGRKVVHRVEHALCHTSFSIGTWHSCEVPSTCWHWSGPPPKSCGPL